MIATMEIALLFVGVLLGFTIGWVVKPISNSQNVVDLVTAVFEKGVLEAKKLDLEEQKLLLERQERLIKHQEEQVRQLFAEEEDDFSDHIDPNFFIRYAPDPLDPNKDVRINFVTKESENE